VVGSTRTGVAVADGICLDGDAPGFASVCESLTTVQKPMKVEADE
jgi:hypothetical protein